MKDAEDDGEIVIKSLFFHLWREKGASFARHHTAMLEAARTTRRCARSAHHGTFSADDEGKRGSSGDLSSRTSACRPRKTDP